MKKILIAALLIVASSLTYAQSDKDADHAGQWEYGHATTYRYLDDGDQWNSGEIGTAAEKGNDGPWNFNNDDQWDSSRAAPIKFAIMTVSGIPTMMVKIGI